MKGIFKIIALVSASLFTLTVNLSSQATTSTPLNQIVVFGDSFSDNGNLYYLSKERTKGLGAVPQEPYSKGRFSNGPVWPEYFRDKNKVVLSNFAYGGAQASQSNPDDNSLQSIPDLGAQVKQYLDDLQANNQSISPKTLIPISIGANDYLDVLIGCDSSTSVAEMKNRINQEVSSVMNALDAAIRQLAAKGTKNFAVFNLPNFERSPALNPNSNVKDANEKGCPDPVGLSKFATDQHNQALSILLPKLRFDFAMAGNNVRVSPVNLEKLLDEVLDGVINNDPAILALFDVKPADAASVDIDNACYTGTIFGYKKNPRLKPCNNANLFAFWDGIHPTTQLHEYFSDSLTTQLQQEGYTVESTLMKAQGVSIEALEKLDAQLRFK